ncbi:MAG: SRPBCC family protein [Actinomycetes bacterium]
MDLHRYRFRSVWPLAAAPEEVFRALRDVDDYPEWWPQVRRVDRIDDGTYDMVVRSVLPYDLVFRSTRSREDEAAGVLEARMAGDLDGLSRWTIREDGAGTTLVFEEQVVAVKTMLRRLAFVARPAFVANHVLMMRAGRRGLRAYLAGRRRGDRT